MTTEMQNPVDELRRLIAEGRLSEASVQAMIGIPSEQLHTVLDETPGSPAGMTVAPHPLSPEENTRISILAAQLTAGMEIDDDARLVAILESLISQCRLTPESIAQLSDLDVDDIVRALNDPRAVSLETKYRLATRGSYLINAATQARAPLAA